MGPDEVPMGAGEGQPVAEEGRPAGRGEGDRSPAGRQGDRAAGSGPSSGRGPLDDDRVRILRLVQQGRLTPEDAVRLLDALGPGPSGERAAGPAARPFGQGRVLRIRVFDEGQDRVRLNIPLGLARSALRLIPRSAAKYMEGIDLNALLDQIEHGAHGKILEVMDDDETGVEIHVE